MSQRNKLGAVSFEHWLNAEGAALSAVVLAALLETGIRGHFCAITCLTGTGLCINATDIPSTAQASLQPKWYCYCYTLTLFILAVPASRSTSMLSWAAPSVTYITDTPEVPGKSKPLQWSSTDYSFASQNWKEKKPSNFTQNPPKTTLCSVMLAHYRLQMGGRERDCIRYNAAKWGKKINFIQMGAGWHL